MNPWKPYPFLRLSIPLLLGVTTAINELVVTGTEYLVFFTLCGLALIILFLTMYPGSYHLRWAPGIPVFLFLFLAGLLLEVNRQSKTFPLIPENDSINTFIASVNEPPVNSGASQKVFLTLKYRHDGDSWKPLTGNVLGYFRNGKSGTVISLGDFIVFRTRIEKMTDNSNPGTFSYVDYLHKKGISHSVSMAGHGWKKLNMEPDNLVRRKAIHLRNRLLGIFRENNLTGKEFAVASALLLGYVNEIDNETRREYAASGAMHILSVSGMHVGIVYVFLNFLLRFLNRYRYGKYIKAIIMLFFIFLYAMITGLSPCVIRAAIMLSLPIIAGLMNRNVDIINVIAVSCFVMVSKNPALLVDVGFQLSYLAVIGIVTLYKPIYDLYITSAWIPDKIWSLLAVSLAAQLATLPITLYVFHQFPNFFLLTNILVVPLSSIIIYTGILLLVVGQVPFLCVLTAKLLIFLIKAMNMVIHLIEELPFSTTTGIYIDEIQVALLFVMVGAVYFYFKSGARRAMKTILIAGILFMFVVTVGKYNMLSTSRYVVYNIKNRGVYEFSEQKRAVTWYTTPSSYRYDMSFMNSVGAHHKSHGIKYHRSQWISNENHLFSLDPEFVELFRLGRFMQFKTIRIAILDTAFPKGLTSEIPVDLVVITGNPRLWIRDIVKVFHPKQIIIDGTNSRSMANHWIREAKNANLPCHYVARDGAYEKEMRKEIWK